MERAVDVIIWQIPPREIHRRLTADGSGLLARKLRLDFRAHVTCAEVHSSFLWLALLILVSGLDLD